jgi:phage terminase large subunit-like protein
MIPRLCGTPRGASRRGRENFLGEARLYAVLADRSTTGSPAQWGEAVVKCHDDFEADDVVVEVNFGGDMATEVVKQAAERVYQHGDREANLIRVKEVSTRQSHAR